MAPLQSETIAPANATLVNARAFVRNLNILLKFARLYGLEHTRSATQFESTWLELEEAVKVAGQSGLLLGASGSQLLLDGAALESTPAERSFAHLLDSSGVASICFTQSVSRDEFTNLVRAFMETGPKAGPLGERLEKYFGKEMRSGVRVNEIRFVAEDSGFSEARVAAQLTAKTLGADADAIQDWFRSPEKMIQLIAAAEGSHGGQSGPGGPQEGGLGPGNGAGTGPGSYYGGNELWSEGAGDGTGVAGSGGSGSGYGTGVGSGGGTGTGAGTAIGSGTGAGTGGGFGSGNGMGTGAGVGTGNGGGTGTAFGGIMRAGVGGPAAAAPLQEAELQSLLRLLVQFGEASHTKNVDNLHQATWQQKLASLPQNAQMTLRQALATVAANSPSAKMDEAMLLRLAEDLAIRFALDRFQRGEVRVNAVRQMLERMGNELGTLRKLLKSREEKLATAGVSVESHADVLDRQFWAAVPESGKRQVLTSSEAWCIPPRNVQQYVEELLGRGESETAGNILLQYASCVRSKDVEARKKAAIGLSQLAELYSKAASQRLQDALLQIGQQMIAETDPELQNFTQRGVRSTRARNLLLVALLSRYATSARFYLPISKKNRGQRGGYQSIRPRIRSRKSSSGIRRRSTHSRKDARGTSGRPDARSDHHGRAHCGSHGARRAPQRTRKDRRVGKVHR